MPENRYRHRVTDWPVQLPVSRFDLRPP